jgi:hypothetical protein
MEQARNYKTLVNNGKFGTDDYMATFATVDAARSWLDEMINTKATRETNYITLQIGDSDGTYRAIATVNNPIAYRR